MWTAERARATVFCGQELIQQTLTIYILAGYAASVLYIGKIDIFGTSELLPKLPVHVCNLRNSSSATTQILCKFFKCPISLCALVNGLLGNNSLPRCCMYSAVWYVAWIFGM
jgi:hypothetical protein